MYENCKLLNLNIHFEKKYHFQKCSNWELPSQVINENELWINQSLKNFKEELNKTKSLLNDKGEDWHRHTSEISKSGLVLNYIKKKCRPEILTQAWAKFFEIISNYNLVPQSKNCIKSLHLCEVPGAFISSLNYFLCSRHKDISWDWHANSLNPYYEGHNIRSVVVDDRLVLPTLKKWYFGQDNTGDITDPNVINDICEIFGTSKVDLITADGSFDCLDNPGEQESVVSQLHYAEIFISLSCLAFGGCLVIKKFTFFECTSVCQLYLLNCVFEQVHVFKPFTSRASNSEVYVVCINFQQSEKLQSILAIFKDNYRQNKYISCFPESAVPSSFIAQLEICSKYFMDYQIQAIQENLFLYNLKDNSKIQIMSNLKAICAEMFMSKYFDFSMPEQDVSKLYNPKRKAIASFHDKRNINCKTLYFHAVGGTYLYLNSHQTTSWANLVLDIESRVETCFPASGKRSHDDAEWQVVWKDIVQKMQSKNFSHWITVGKAFKIIQNSKFCNPLLLHLWNKISDESKIDDREDFSTSWNWDIDILKNFLKYEQTDYALINASPPCVYENDSLLINIKTVLNVKEVILSYACDSYKGIKIIYLNFSNCKKSLHQEVHIKDDLVKIMVDVLQVLNKGDTLLLCIQSVLTRFVTGILFTVLSLFEKFFTALPENYAAPAEGQLWILKNFQNPPWIKDLIQYFKIIMNFNVSEDKEILEVVPMSALCGGPFCSFLQTMNYHHLLQRLRRIIAVEKRKLKIS